MSSKNQFKTYYGSNKLKYTLVFTKRKNIVFKTYPTGEIKAFAPYGTALTLIRNRADLESENLFRQVFFHMLLNPYVNKKFIITNNTI
ncbi:hypothetical protein [uncultured Dokdonia sp.]|uniref:hypothetical protein n=1 Tax=uncultured Dokdonia sp. TaxID=575653 RepID=UPI002628B94E|nr:hypothetical protein [uncultured Dokdonia sp.]